ncbi:hypothetical protein M5689_020441 [Euphorbia peplus]|nr:hypothetical protein M5689_020441 [Euphorbia peplus]
MRVKPLVNTKSMKGMPADRKLPNIFFILKYRQADDTFSSMSRLCFWKVDPGSDNSGRQEHLPSNMRA